MKLDSVDPNGVYIVEGHGFGHGVGMSQYGVQWRAEKHNHTVEEILKFYYTGIEIIRLNLSTAWDVGHVGGDEVGDGAL